MKNFDKNSKKDLSIMLNLIERMDNNKSKMLIKEAIKNSKRVQVTRDQILDILDQQNDNNAGQYASFTYVTPIDPYKAKRKWRYDDVQNALDKHSNLSDREWYQSLSSYNDASVKGDNPIQSIIAVHKYTIHWTSPKSYATKYAEYKNKLSDLRMRNGVGIESDGMLGDNNNQRQSMGYGDVQANQTGNLSRDFNMIDSTCKTKWYILDENGSVIDSIPEELVKSMIAVPSKGEFSNVEVAVREALSGNEEALQKYSDEKREIEKSFKGRNFLLDKILSIVATSEGMQYYYINDAIATKIRKKSDVNVNRSEFIKIAEEELEEQFNDISYEEFSK